MIRLGRDIKAYLSFNTGIQICNSLSKIIFIFLLNSIVEDAVVESILGLIALFGLLNMLNLGSPQFILNRSLKTAKQSSYFYISIFLAVNSTFLCLVILAFLSNIHFFDTTNQSVKVIFFVSVIQITVGFCSANLLNFLRGSGDYLLALKASLAKSLFLLLFTSCAGIYYWIFKLGIAVEILFIVELLGTIGLACFIIKKTWKNKSLIKINSLKRKFFVFYRKMLPFFLSNMQSQLLNNGLMLYVVYAFEPEISIAYALLRNVMAPLLLFGGAVNSSFYDNFVRSLRSNDRIYLNPVAKSWAGVLICCAVLYSFTMYWVAPSLVSLVHDIDASKLVNLSLVVFCFISTSVFIQFVSRLSAATNSQILFVVMRLVFWSICLTSILIINGFESSYGYGALFLGLTVADLATIGFWFLGRAKWVR